MPEDNQRAELTEERRSSDFFWKAAFRQFYAQQFGKKPSQAYVGQAFEVGLALCQDLDAGNHLKDIFRRAAANMSSDDVYLFNLIALTSVRQTYDEHESALDEFLNPS